MFKSIFGFILPKSTQSKHRSTQSKQSKRLGKQNYTQVAADSRVDTFTHTAPEERERMFARYIEGESINSIAKEFSRSSRTVHRVLTSRGTHSLPERVRLPSNEFSDEPPSHSSRRSLRRKKRADRDGDEVRGSDSFMERVEPILAEGAVKYLKENPEFAIQVATAMLGIKLDKPTLDDIAIRTIRDDPDFRREWAETHLGRMKRNGRTEMDILKEGVDLICSMVERMHKPTTINDVISDAVRTGEFSKLVEALVRVVKSGAPSPAQASPPTKVEPTPNQVPKESEPVRPSLPPEVAPIIPKPRKHHIWDGYTPEERKKLADILRSSVIPKFDTSEGLDINQEPENSGKGLFGKGPET